MESSKRSLGKRRSVPTTRQGLFGKAVADVKPLYTSTSSSDGGQIMQVNPEVIKQITAVVCKGIPDEENNRDALGSHFSKFGKITRITCYVEKQQAVINFQTHQQALNAKTQGSIFGARGTQLTIFWKKPTTRPRRKSKSDAERELESMAGTSETNFDKLLKKEVSAVKERGKRKIKKEPQKSSKTYKSDPSLLKILEKPANSDNDRLEILNVRDRLIRAKNKHAHVDMSKSKIFRGTCQDMCPEKERYDRQEKKQLSIFELHPLSQPGEHIVEHSLAVKEYSRSSADQDEPLPFELRPTNVLAMTMDYLICNFIHLLDTQTTTNPSDWYDFLWNRTRAIRKDITQQHLCNLEVVALIEKCARFHIYCSERLCEEDMMTFDQKINNENLTKCMQTLKHFYYDLSVKGIQCPCEAEFRSYDILLNLSRGEILREVQQLSPEIRKSSHVDFALNVLNAFNSNNFNRFFKLLDSGSFLHCCILHRYFTQVRTKGLHTLIKAYCPSQHSVHYPLRDLIVNLGFEDDTEAVSFCNSHGLTGVESAVTLNRNLFCYPESAPVLIRAKKLIESKIDSSLGQIVNGAPLPENPKSYYIPHYSFTSTGLLKREAYDATDQSLKDTQHDERQSVAVRQDHNKQLVTASELFKPAVESQVANSEMFKPVEPQVANSEMFKPVEPQIANSEMFKPVEPQVARKEAEVISMDVLKDVVHDVVKETTNDLIAYITHGTLLWMKHLDNQAVNILANLTTEIVREVCSKELLEAKLQQQAQKEREEKMKMEFEMREKRVTLLISEDLIGQVTRKEVQTIASTEMKDVVKKLVHQCQERSIASLGDEFIQATITSLMEEISSTVYHQTVVLVKGKLKALRTRIDTRIMKKYFKLWKHKHILNTRLKNATKTFPSGPNFLSLQNQLRLLGPEIQVYSYEEISSCNSKNSHLLDTGCLGQLIASEYEDWPLNIPRILQDKVPPLFSGVLQGETCFWKLCLSLPSGNGNDTFVHWIKRKFSRGTTTTDRQYKQVKTLSLFSADIFCPNTRFNKLGVCIKSVKGLIDSAVSNDFTFHGTLGILLTVETTGEDDHSALEECHQRLSCLLECKPKYPAIPVVILAIGDDITTDQVISQTLRLDHYSKNNFISYFKINRICRNYKLPSCTQQLIDAVCWLGERCPKLPSISNSTLAEFVETNVLRHTLKIICEDKEERNRLGLLQQDPNVIIDYINSALDHMMTVENMGLRLDVSWPPGEFCYKHDDLPPKDWSSVACTTKVSKVLKSLRLHKLPDVDSWDEACNIIWDYVELHEIPGIDNTDVIRRVDYMLERAERHFNENCYSEFSLDECEPTVANIPWTDVILTVVDYLLTYLSCLSRDYPNVYYIEDRLVRPCMPSSWLEATSVSCRQESIRFQDSIMKSVGKRKLEISEEEPPLTKLKFQKSELQIEADKMTQNLLKKLQEERLKLTEFDEKLQCAEGQEIYQSGMEILYSDDEDELALSNQEVEKFPAASMEEQLEKIHVMLECSRKKSSKFDKKLSTSLQLE